MTREEAVKILNKYDLNFCDIDGNPIPPQDLAEAFDMAIVALQQDPIIQCEECKHHGTSNCPMWGDDTTEDYMWCCDGERMESDE